MASSKYILGITSQARHVEYLLEALWKSLARKPEKLSIKDWEALNDYFEEQAIEEIEHKARTRKAKTCKKAKQEK